MKGEKIYLIKCENTLNASKIIKRRKYKWARTNINELSFSHTFSSTRILFRYLLVKITGIPTNPFYRFNQISKGKKITCDYINILTKSFEYLSNKTRKQRNQSLHYQRWTLQELEWRKIDCSVELPTFP